MSKKLILASTSPRRQKLLRYLGIPFEIVHSNYIEDNFLQLPPDQLVQKLAYEKALEVANRVKNSVVIGGDSLVTFEGKVYGKPKSETEAFQMLNMFNGKMQIVFTGTCIIDADTKKHEEFTVSCDVYFRNYTQEEIQDYLKTGESLTRAGGYAVQEKGSVFVERVDGDFIDAVGLPTKELFLRLPKYGFKPWS